jgi:hypothetical protein
MTENFLFRGVHGGHPANAAARKGKAVPGDPKGTITAEQHNRGGRQIDSPFTSWTRNYQIALNHALRFGPGGVVLRLPVGAPGITDAWSWERSPDDFGEDEILLRGERSGATVEVL